MGGQCELSANTSGERASGVQSIPARPGHGVRHWRRRRTPLADVRGLLLTFWRRKLVIVAAVLVALALVFLVVRNTQARYSADATVIFEPSDLTSSRCRTSSTSRGAARGSLQNQVEILRSSSLLGSVAEKPRARRNPRVQPGAPGRGAAADRPDRRAAEPLGAGAAARRRAPGRSDDAELAPGARRPAGSAPRRRPSPRRTRRPSRRRQREEARHRAKFGAHPRRQPPCFTPVSGLQRHRAGLLLDQFPPSPRRSSTPSPRTTSPTRLPPSARTSRRSWR